MSALSSELAARVAKLLPRLASNHTGEIAATAAAITRTLKAGGHDLHDLAEYIAEAPRTVVVYRERPAGQGPSDHSSRSWRDASSHAHATAAHHERVARCLEAGGARLTDWEAAFLLSLAQQLDRKRGLSAKQACILDGLAEKLEVSV